MSPSRYLDPELITKDVPSQRSLFHVLHCFSMYCQECGYCQGMGPIAATLLSYFDAPVSRLEIPEFSLGVLICASCSESMR